VEKSLSSIPPTLSPLPTSGKDPKEFSTHDPRRTNPGRQQGARPTPAQEFSVFLCRIHHLPASPKWPTEKALCPLLTSLPPAKSLGCDINSHVGFHVVCRQKQRPLNLLPLSHREPSLSTPRVPPILHSTSASQHP
jgi:hypothetical protein